jgi:hypothetical protein
MRPDRLSDEWFEQAVRVSAPPSERSSALPAAMPAGDPVWSVVLGAIAGAIGGFVFAFIVGGSRALAHGEALGATVLVGAAMGALFGRVTRRLLRVVPRMIVGASLASATWLTAYAFVLMRFEPHWARALPIATSILAALACGACMGALPPIGVRDERGKRV